MSKVDYALNEITNLMYESAKTNQKLASLETKFTSLETKVTSL